MWQFDGIFGVFWQFSVECQQSLEGNASRKISPQNFVKTICKKRSRREAREKLQRSVINRSIKYQNDGSHRVTAQTFCASSWPKSCSYQDISQKLRRCCTGVVTFLKSFCVVFFSKSIFDNFHILKKKIEYCKQTTWKIWTLVFWRTHVTFRWCKNVNYKYF